MRQEMEDEIHVEPERSDDHPLLLPLPILKAETLRPLTLCVPQSVSPTRTRMPT